MANVQGQADISNIKDNDQFKVYASRLLSSIVDVVNGNIDVVGNLNIQILSDLSVVAGADNTYSHSLGRVPQGYWITKSNSASIVLALSATTPPTSEAISFRSSASGTISVLIF